MQFQLMLNYSHDNKLITFFSETNFSSLLWSFNEIKIKAFENFTLRKKLIKPSVHNDSCCLAYAFTPLNSAAMCPRYLTIQKIIYDIVSTLFYSKDYL